MTKPQVVVPRQESEDRVSTKREPAKEADGVLTQIEVTTYEILRKHNNESTRA